MTKKKETKKLKIKLEPYLYILPALILLGVFKYYPFIKSFVLSFFRITSKGHIREFVGLKNYVNILKDVGFRKVVKNSFQFAIVSVPFGMIIGLILSIIANKKRKASPIYELLFALTMAVSSSVAAMVFQLLYNPTIGILNHWLGVKINWLNDSGTALFALTVIWIWLNIGYNFIFMLSAIRGIPEELLESADIDGANFWQKIVKVITPMISPTLFYLFVTQIASSLMMSALTLILTNGGPQGSTGTMIQYMLDQSVNNQNYNAGYAAAMIVFVITGIAMRLAMSVEKKGVHYQ